MANCGYKEGTGVVCSNMDIERSMGDQGSCTFSILQATDLLMV